MKADRHEYREQRKRGGHHGQTDLFGGQSTTKDNPRVQAYGEADELNSHIGLARTACSFDEISAVLVTLQNHLFELGADLATPADSPHADKVSRICQTHIDWAEHAIDAAWAPLPAMKTFILPGGSELAARLHVARTVCRRAERSCVTLASQKNIGLMIVIYLNRVSDLLFALARRANQLAGVDDVPWVSH